MIETEGLSKDFGTFRAVDHVSLRVEPGTVLALLGPNGAGKTTTVRMLTSILRPTTGWARVAGYDVTTHPVQVRQHVGVLTEQHGLYERMRGLQYLDFFARLYRLDPAEGARRARALMERFGLGDALDKRLGEYSKGMKQKLALVRAMLHDPPVLLLDEPTSAMDPQSAKLVRDAIVELRHEARTFIVTTHNLTEAEHLADRIAIIRHGRIIALGTFPELSQRFVGTPTMELRLRTPINGLAQSLGDMVEVTEQGERWLRYRVAQPDVTNPLLLRRLLNDGVDVVTLSPLQDTLEAVYLRIVEEDEKHEHDHSNPL
ncbi:MAG: ABC transporter ATP-binding protein [Anaerolineae bacterium]|nr:ABC transporter ATP-binding protein [Anaerolineae bacterium]